MRLLETDLPGCVLIEPQVHRDERGFFYESWNQARFDAAGLPVRFVQANVSWSRRDVLRGLHFQRTGPQGKLVCVLDGEIWDVAVDVRRGSPNFGRWTAATLSGENHRALWIPEGLAHGFVVRSDSALVHYLCTRPYDAGDEGSVRWDDPRIGIPWPVRTPLLSPRDAVAPRLDAIDPDRLPRYRGDVIPSGCARSPHR